MTLVDKDGERVAPVYDYFAYGKQIAENTNPQQVTQTFTGKEFDLFENNVVTGDDGEGLYYFGKRYYDAEIGRWTSVDPMGQYVDAYLYGGNNPANRIDPDGGSDIDMCPECRHNIMWELSGENIAVYTQLYREQLKMTAVGLTIGVGVIASPLLMEPPVAFGIKYALQDGSRRLLANPYTSTMAKFIASYAFLESKYQVSKISLQASRFSLKNPESLIAMAELAKDVVDGIDQSTPPDNPRSSVIGIIWDKINNFFSE